MSTGTLIVKTYQEPAVMAIMEEAGRLRSADGGGKYIIEQSPVNSRGSNGMVERAIRSVEHQVKVMKDALEYRWSSKLGAKHSIVPWMIEYAAVLLNRFEVSKDGKTAFERNKGRKAKTLGIEFGEAVLWKRRADGGALGKFTCLWEDGVYLGLRGSSGELIVGDEKGVWRTRTIQRKPVQTRWGQQEIEKVRWVPWAKNEDDPEIDGEKMEVTRMTRREVEEEKKPDVKAPMRFQIKKEDLDKHGFTSRCWGCRAMMKGTTRQAHSEECRKRMTEAMSNDERVKKSERNIDEYMASKLEEQDKKRAKTEDNVENQKDEGSGQAAGSGLSAEERGESKEVRKRGQEEGASNQEGMGDEEEVASKLGGAQAVFGKSGALTTFGGLLVSLGGRRGPQRHCPDGNAVKRTRMEEEARLERRKKEGEDEMKDNEPEDLEERPKKMAKDVETRNVGGLEVNQERDDPEQGRFDEERYRV